MNYEQVLRYAMQMEQDGMNFFNEKAELFSNPTTTKLFRELAKVELEHYKYLEHQLNNFLENNEFDLSDEVMEREEDIFKQREQSEHIVETLTESDIPDMTILRTAYLIERDFKEFYENAAENASDEGIKKIFTKLARWEAGHEKLFKKEYDKLMSEYMTLPWGG